MTASSQQCSPSLFHPAWLPNSGVRMPQSLSGGFEDINEDSIFSFYSSDPHDNVAVDVSVYGESCLENNDRMISSGDPEPSVLIEPQSGDQVTPEKTHMDKRKNDQFRDVTRGKEKKRKKSQCTNEKKDTEETSGSTAYVHVRSRRGQATNSHSLAERARREKISKKMKQLQALVPGCDKISHTALVLDAIINYMKSLQSQVESLSRKLAFVNSMSYGFGGDLDDFMKLDTLAFCPIQPTVLPEDGTTFITTNNYPILDSCTVCESQLQQGLSPFFFSQDNEDLLGDVEEQKQMLINQSSQFNNLCKSEY